MKGKDRTRGKKFKTIIEGTGSGGSPFCWFKICLIGSNIVGKTCIAKRLCFDTFEVNTILTLGVEFYSYDLPILVWGEKTFIRLQIWEFGGQEHFKKLFRYYLMGSAGIFFVFDLSDLDSLTKLDWWYDRLKEYNMITLPKMLIGTKFDLIDDKSKRARNNTVIYKEFLKNHKEMDFVKTSAKENLNIQSIAKEMAIKILNINNLDYDTVI
ncbi:MAG: Rab family GTPase [Promethearchaeota archaeon]|jgi:small GTP-binding protein